MSVRVNGTVADRIEKRPHATGSGPAGGITAWAFVRCRMWRGKLVPWVTTMGCKYKHSYVWRPNQFNWTDRWQRSLTKSWSKYA